MTLRFLLQIAFSVAALCSLSKAATAEDDNPLAIFDAYTDRVWESNNGKTGAKRFHDISTWTTILGGKAIRTEHSVNDGGYQGATHIFYDPASKVIRMHYVTTAGFYTEGTAWLDGDIIRFHETVKGNTQGITDVEASSQIIDGNLIVSSRMKSNGEWGALSKAIYKLKKD